MTAIGDNLTCMLDMSELQAAFICLVRVSTRSRTLKTDSPACMCCIEFIATRFGDTDVYTVHLKP